MSYLYTVPCEQKFKKNESSSELDYFCGRCRKEVGRLSISIIMPAPDSPMISLIIMVPVVVTTLRSKELLGAKSFQLRI